MDIMRKVAIVKAFGFTVEGLDAGDVDTPEAAFLEVVGGDGETGVIMWSGSWPFAVDHDMGVLPSFEEAVRYAVWLLKRESFYHERDEKRLMEIEERDRLWWENRQAHA